MTEASIPFYANWHFWSAFLALIAIILSQLPHVRLWFRPARLEIEAHFRVQLTHQVGLPNVGLMLSLQNVGGRDLLVRAIRLRLTRDSTHLMTLPALTYFENQNSQQQSLMVPFRLRVDVNVSR